MKDEWSGRSVLLKTASISNGESAILCAILVSLSVVSTTFSLSLHLGVSGKPQSDTVPRYRQLCHVASRHPDLQRYAPEGGGANRALATRTVDVGQRN